MTKPTEGDPMDEDATHALAEAMFRATLSDPNGEAADRAWDAMRYSVGYREAIVRSQLQMLGYDVTEIRLRREKQTAEQRAAVIGAALEAIRPPAHASAAGLCSRLLVGQGSDISDPTCVLQRGHTGRCFARRDSALGRET